MELQGWITIGLSVFALICGFVVWAMNLILKPMKIALQNNTEAFNLINKTISGITHDVASLDKRMIKTETIHAIRGCAHHDPDFEGD